MKRDVITLDNQGHMVIPLTSKEYVIYDALLEIDLTQDDFENYEGKWDRFFNKLEKNKLDYHDLSVLIHYLPNVIYMEFKKNDLISDYKEGDMLKICGFMVYPKSKIFKKTTISILVDHLRRKRTFFERMKDKLVYIFFGVGLRRKKR